MSIEITRKVLDVGEVREVDAKRRRIVGIASREVVDREGDVVRIAGIDTTHFEGNPVLLGNHDRGFPLGRVTSLRAETRDGVPALVFEADILPRGTSARVDEAWAAIEAGARNGISIGFIARDFEPLPAGRGMLFTRTELLEISSVSLPACPTCLAEAKSLCACATHAAAVEDEPVLVLAADDPAPAVAPACHRTIRAHAADVIAQTVLMCEAFAADFGLPPGIGREADLALGCVFAAYDVLPSAEDGRLTLSRRALAERIKAEVRAHAAPLEAQLRALAATVEHRRAASAAIAEPEPGEATVDPQELTTVIRGALTEVVQHEARAVVNALRGRLD